MDRQLATRRRYGSDLGDGLNHGWDEIIDGKPTGRIIFDWSYEEGKTLYRYAPEGVTWEPDPRSLRPSSRISKPNKKIDSDTKIVTEHINVIEPIDIFDMTPRTEEKTKEAMHVNDPPSFADRLLHTPPKEQYVMMFDWVYGTEKIFLDSVNDASARRRQIEQTFGPDLSATMQNWRIVCETIQTEDLGWPFEDAA